MKKSRLKIGDVAKELNLKKSLIRQWEEEFDLNSRKQSTYTVEDMKVLVHLKDLIKTQGLPFDQAKVEIQKLPEYRAIPAKRMAEKKEASEAAPVIKPIPSMSEKPETSVPVAEAASPVEESDTVAELKVESKTTSMEDIRAELAEVEKILETKEEEIELASMAEEVAEAAPPITVERNTASINPAKKDLQGELMKAVSEFKEALIEFRELLS